MQASAATAAAPPRLARRGTCGECGERIVLARLRNRVVVVLDFEEVLPPTPCPLCRQVIARRHTLTGWCYRCGGTTMIGEVLPQPGVALNPEGLARVFKGQRRTGEAVHRIHRCAASAALAA